MHVKTRWRINALASLVVFLFLVAGQVLIVAQAKDATARNTLSARPRIILLATGGTIAGASSVRSSTAYNSGILSAQQLIDQVPDIAQIATLQTEQVANIGSQDMNDAIWLRLAARINEIFSKNLADGVVITHGTDTLEETAFFLDNVVRSDKPVVIVGAMRPSNVPSADGPSNLLNAIRVAASANSVERHVLVVMNGEIHAPRWVTKIDTTAVQAFRSPFGGVLGYVNQARVLFLAPAVKRTRWYDVRGTALLPRVEIVYAHSNMDGAQIDDAISRGAKGIVLAGEGDGNASKAALAALERATQAGIVVVRSSRVGAGLVERNIEVDDDKSGFLTSYDLNPQKARILLQLLILEGIADNVRMQAAFQP